LVITSDQISAMAGNFQAQTMSQMQHAAMISQQVGQGQSTGESIMGKATNMGAAVGAPVMAGGMALAGIDPISLGARGVMSGSAVGMGAGLMAAGGVGAALMAGQYVGDQMMTGMQQQQRLNTKLRGSFNFQNQSGGRGFTMGGMHEIGGSLRAMSQEKGPGGEITSMDELTRMAGQMGQMGMGRGVSSAHEFNEKFKKMMSQVKEIATAFNTSLEEAQQVMSGMRSSGIFSNQGQVSQDIRSYSLAGGLATSEITAAMGVGSQISRSIGGRGKAGAKAGMKTLGQIGIAQQTGVLSEEDIYNQTGLTGAEGRQAMSTSMMSSSARFLKGGLGRRFIASLAGKDGKLDASSVDQYMYGGGVGTGDTMRMAHKNLGKVGRANFIKNEGRLRGEALGEFGGLAPAMVMKGWLSKRGLDVGSDRAQIFMQRRLGMGNDEIENMQKMVRNLPMMMRERQFAGERADITKSMSRYGNESGLKGVKKKLDSARNAIQGTLQQAGADFYKEGANMLERWANNITGDYHKRIVKDLPGLVRTAMGTTQYSISQTAKAFGTGSNFRVGGMDVAQRAMAGAAGVSDEEVFRKSGAAKRFAEAGYVGADPKELMARARADADAFAQGGGEGINVSDRLKEMVSIGSAYGSGLQGKGKKRIDSFGRLLKKSGDSLYEEFKNASDERKSRIFGSVARASGAFGREGGVMEQPDDRGAGMMFGIGGFRTDIDRKRAIGEQFLKNYNASGEEERREKMSEHLSGGARFVANIASLGVGDAASKLGIGSVKRAESYLKEGADKLSSKGGGLDRAKAFADKWIGGKKVGWAAGRTDKMSDAAGDYSDSDEFGDISRLAFSKDAGEREKARQMSRKVSKKLMGKAGSVGKMKDGAAKAKVHMLQGAEAASHFVDLRDSLGEEPTDEQLDKLSEENNLGLNADQMRHAARVTGAKGLSDAKDKRDQVMAAIKHRGIKKLSSFKAAKVSGTQAALFTSKGLVSAAGIEQLSSKDGGNLSGKTLDQAKLYLRYAHSAAKASSTGLDDNGDSARSYRHNAKRSLSNLTPEEQQKVGMAFSSDPALREDARGITMRAGIQKVLQRGKGQSGRAETVIGGQLGMTHTAKQRRIMRSKSPEVAAGMMLSGLEDYIPEDSRKDVQKQMASILGKTRSGKGLSEAADQLAELQGGVLNKARKAKQDAQSAQDDPSYRVLTDILGALSKELTVKVAGTVSTADVNGGGVSSGEATKARPQNMSVQPP